MEKKLELTDSLLHHILFSPENDRLLQHLTEQYETGEVLDLTDLEAINDEGHSLATSVVLEINILILLHFLLLCGRGFYRRIFK